MSLVRLPYEMLEAIASKVESDRDLSAIARTSRLLHAVAGAHLYRRDSRRQESKALRWAAIHNQVETARTALKFGIPDSWASLLMLASTFDSVDVMELLLDQEGVDPNCGKPDGIEDSDGNDVLDGSDGSDSDESDGSNDDNDDNDDSDDSDDGVSEIDDDIDDPEDDDDSHSSYNSDDSDDSDSDDED